MTYGERAFRARRMALAVFLGTATATVVLAEPVIRRLPPVLKVETEQSVRMASAVSSTGRSAETPPPVIMRLPGIDSAPAASEDNLLSRGSLSQPQRANRPAAGVPINALRSAQRPLGMIDVPQPTGSRVARLPDPQQVVEVVSPVDETETTPDERAAIIHVPPPEIVGAGGDRTQVPTPTFQEPSTVALIPIDFAPWWQSGVTDALRPGVEREPTDVTSLVLNALVYSEQIRALREQPLIKETSILEAEAEFDPRAFMESKFIKTSEPVGDELTTGTGGPSRFRESDWYYSAGVRKKTAKGAKVELSQRIGYLDNNSLFFVPTQQGNGRLTLSFEQPLLRGAGEYYNTSLIVLAEVETRIADTQTERDIQAYLLEVHRAYWDLYLQRASLLQMQRSLSRAEEILVALEQREDFDSLRSQIVIAQAAVATRRSELVRAFASIQNGQARIAALINMPGMAETQEREMVPVSLPSHDYAPIMTQDAIVTALSNRPEIDEAVNQMDAARVRLDVSHNELLPALSVVLETYVSGLEGRSRVGGAWLNQFREGEPSYTAGLVFEVPLWNRAAASRHERRHRELRQLIHRFNSLVANLRAEVEVAVREVDTTFREMQSRYASMQAAAAEVDFMTQRWQLLPGDDRAASFLLEDLLTAQDRLAREEFAFAEARISYAVAQAELKKVMGVLMDYEVVLPPVLPEAEIDPFVLPLVQ